jgi:hypothetical protein
MNRLFFFCMGCFAACAGESTITLAPVSTSIPAAVLDAPSLTTASFLPIGLVTEEITSTAYLMAEPTSKKYQIDAFQIKDGSKLWSSTAAEKPLWVKGNRLIAQKSDGRLVVLDTQSGAPIPSCELDPGLVLPSIPLASNEYQFVSVGEDDQGIFIFWYRSLYPKQGNSWDTYRGHVDKEFDIISVDPKECKAYGSNGFFRSTDGSVPFTSQIIPDSDGVDQLLIEEPSGAIKTISLSKNINPRIVVESEKYVVISEWEESDTKSADRLIYSLPDGKEMGSQTGLYPTLVGDVLVLVDTDNVRAIDIPSQKQLWSMKLRKTD